MPGFYAVEWDVDFEGEQFDSPGEAAAAALQLILSGQLWSFTVIDQNTEEEFDVVIEPCDHGTEDTTKVRVSRKA